MLNTAVAEIYQIIVRVQKVTIHVVCKSMLKDVEAGNSTAVFSRSLHRLMHVTLACSICGEHSMNRDTNNSTNKLMKLPEYDILQVQSSK